MPSSRKRIGFLPSVGVQDIINSICSQEGISHSKITGLLVEEALFARGLYGYRKNKSDIFTNKYLSKLDNFCRINNPNLKTNLKNDRDIFKEDSISSEIINDNYTEEEYLILNNFLEYKKFKRMLFDKNNK